MAKTTFIFAALLCCPLFAFSQTTISGQVFDSETGKPVPDAVVGTNDGKSFVVTDEDGRYTISANPAELVYFQQLAYNYREIPLDSLIMNPNVYLDYRIVELGEITVEPLFVKEILSKALQNLYNRMPSKQKNFYLLHSEKESSINGRMEAYALIDVSLNVNPKKMEMKSDIDLLRLDVVSNKIDSSMYSDKGRLINGLIFPSRFYFIGINNSNVFKRYENKDGLLVIKSSPKKSDADPSGGYLYNLFTVNLEDTTLVEWIFQQSMGTRGSKAYFKVKFSDEEGSYKLEEFTDWKNLTYQLKLVTCTSIHAVEPAATDKSAKKKRIKQWDSVLFESDFTATPGFWKKYIGR
ncbi:MAG: hypothetical protein LBR64_04275 [Dysgonamonadaceae bacterium]|nr:hypothetical protein [Dysgonamonadaceae bacterium]